MSKQTIKKSPIEGLDIDPDNDYLSISETGVLELYYCEEDESSVFNTENGDPLTIHDLSPRQYKQLVKYLTNPVRCFDNNYWDISIGGDKGIWIDQEVINEITHELTLLRLLAIRENQYSKILDAIHPKRKKK
jgi:hypothetical protein